jgi:hypothetical protein
MILAIVTAVFMTAAAFGQTHPCDSELPHEGSWTAPDGGLLEGRISEAWCLSPFDFGQPGNTLNAESWDDAALGTQWKIWGMSIDAAGAVEGESDFNEAGFGWVDYNINYEGGRFWLEGSNPWSDGTDLEGNVTLCNFNTRVTYVNFVIPVAASSNITVVGIFDICPECSIEIGGNSMRLWMTGAAGAMPSDYPPFLCGANSGELQYTCCLTATIMCSVTGNEESTWGAIKEMYR